VEGRQSWTATASGSRPGGHASHSTNRNKEPPPLLRTWQLSHPAFQHPRAGGHARTGLPPPAPRQPPAPGPVGSSRHGGAERAGDCRVLSPFRDVGATTVAASGCRWKIFQRLAGVDATRCTRADDDVVVAARLTACSKVHSSARCAVEASGARGMPTRQFPARRIVVGRGRRETGGRMSLLVGRRAR